MCDFAGFTQRPLDFFNGNVGNLNLDCVSPKIRGGKPEIWHLLHTSIAIINLKLFENF
jgi:hypothetical protein